MSARTCESNSRPEEARRRNLELGRYMTAGGITRALVARRGSDGVLRLFDLALTGGAGARGYFVEAGLDSKAELSALRRLYLADAKRIGESPMSRAAIDRVIDAAMDPIREAIS